jgi:putative ABC transport system substrate-binding protein
MTQRIGILDSTSAASYGEQYAAFKRGLKEVGYVDGENVTFEYKYANNDYDRLERLAADLVKDDVAMIVAAGGPVTAEKAALAAAGQKSIVFTSVTDAVANRLRKSKNLTGIAGKTSELDPIRLQLLCWLLSTARAIGVLVNAKRPTRKEESMALRKAVGELSLKRKVDLDIDNVGSLDEIAASVEKFAKAGLDGLLVTADPFFNSHRAQLVKLAKRHALPAIYQWREFATAGGLMSYGPASARPTVRPVSTPASSSRGPNRPSSRSWKRAGSSSS